MKMRTPGRLVAVLGLVTLLGACGSEPAGAATGWLAVEGADGHGRLQVEIARSSEERAQGLSGRSSLPTDHGMVFLYPEPRRGAFWMKDTSIPLRIGFWDASGTVISVMDMTPCAADPCPRYDPGVSYVGAVEASADDFEQQGITTGAHVELQGSAS